MYRLYRAKSEALFNTCIYSLLKQNIKPCNAKRRWQRKRTKQIRSNYQKTTLHVQHTFYVHFFAVVLHDYNVKLSETS